MNTTRKRNPFVSTQGVELVENFRIEKRMNKKNMAELLGMTPEEYSRLIHFRRSASMATVATLSKFFRKSPHFFYALEETTSQ